MPQGSIPGALLFFLYANDLTSLLLSSNIACCADDTKLYKTIDTCHDAELLQDDINSLGKWSSCSGLNFIELKTKAQSITRKKALVKYPYQLKDRPSEKLDAERDLGVWITSDLTWSKQVVVHATTANRMLGLVRRTLREVTDSCVRRTTYLAIIRPHLGYATQIWSPQSIKLIRRAEQVQRRATKVILNLPFHSSTSYKQRPLTLNLLPIIYWHEYLDVIFFF